MHTCALLEVFQSRNTVQVKGQKELGHSQGSDCVNSAMQPLLAGKCVCMPGTIAGLLAVACVFERLCSGHELPQAGQGGKCTSGTRAQPVGVERLCSGHELPQAGQGGKCTSGTRAQPVGVERLCSGHALSTQGSLMMTSCPSHIPWPCCCLHSEQHRG
jgi:hypothetical protein